MIMLLASCPPKKNTQTNALKSEPLWACADTMPRRSSCDAAPAAPSAQQFFRNVRRVFLATCVLLVRRWLSIELALRRDQREIHRRVCPFDRTVGGAHRHGPDRADDLGALLERHPACHEQQAAVVDER